MWDAFLLFNTRYGSVYNIWQIQLKEISKSTFIIIQVWLMSHNPYLSRHHNAESTLQLHWNSFKMSTSFQDVFISTMWHLDIRNVIIMPIEYLWWNVHLCHSHSLYSLSLSYWQNTYMSIIDIMYVCVVDVKLYYIYNTLMYICVLNAMLFNIAQSGYVIYFNSNMCVC